LKLGHTVVMLHRCPAVFPDDDDDGVYIEATTV